MSLGIVDMLHAWVTRWCVDRDWKRREQEEHRPGAAWSSPGWHHRRGEQHYRKILLSGRRFLVCVCIQFEQLTTTTSCVVILNFCNQIWQRSFQFWPSDCEYKVLRKRNNSLLFFFFCLFQRVISKDGAILSKAPSGMQSGGEEEQDEEAHTPLPPPMEIIKDPSAQDEKVGRGR